MATHRPRPAAACHVRIADDIVQLRQQVRRPEQPRRRQETFGIQVVNASDVTVTVRISGPLFAQTSVTVVPFGFKPVEVDAATGDAITFQADGGGYPTATGGCSAGADAVDGFPDIYAQINILPPLTVGGPVQIVCSSGWQ